MKPVVLGLGLILIFVVVIGTASLADCPTCIFAYDGNSLTDANPYAGCPTCVFSYDSSGNPITNNPYAGCPTCIFSYDSDGNLITNTNTGCSSCGFSSGTSNTVGTCSSCSVTLSVSPTGTSFTIHSSTRRAELEEASTKVRNIVVPTSSFSRPSRITF
jgi:hypothetical protein